MLAALALSWAAAAAAQSPPPAEGIAWPELQALCRGESRTEPGDFRTDAAHRLYVAYNRARCHAYLLGIAEGLRHAGRLCAPLPRDAGRQLRDAVLASEPPAGGTAALVEQLLRTGTC